MLAADPGAAPPAPKPCPVCPPCLIPGQWPSLSTIADTVETTRKKVLAGGTLSAVLVAIGLVLL